MSKSVIERSREEALAAGGDEDESILERNANARTLKSKESDYQRRKKDSLQKDAGKFIRHDPFSDKAPEAHAMSYTEVMKQRALEREEQAILQAIEKQRREGGEPPAAGMDIDSSSSSPSSSSSSGRGGRWSSRGGDDVSATPSSSSSSEWAVEKPASGSRKRSRWDQTPVGASGAAMQTPMGDAGLQTPMTGAMMTPREMTARRYQHEIDVRNQPWTNEQLDELLPGDDEGFAILDPPEDYQPPARKIQATPTPMRGSDALFTMPEDGLMTFEKVVTVDGGVEFTKPEDHEVFGQLLEEVDEDELTEDEKKERTMMKWLIRIKNGTPAQRKSSMRRVTENARWIGPDLLFRKGILPVLMSESLEELERHYFVKVIDRVLYKLDDLVRPYVSSILTVIQPMLIDGDFHARVEGREIISSLAKAAGLGHMIATMRPDLDHADEYVRNTTARAFAVVASALGVHSMLKFLGAVTTSKKSWQARHTGIRIVQHIATLLGVGVLPHLTQMVSVIKHGLEDEHAKVRCVTGLALAALAEASHPYGIESFGPIVRPLWKGIRSERGKTLAAFIKAIGYIIPLMEPEHADVFTKQVMKILIREMASPEEEMKRIVLQVVAQVVQVEGVETKYVREEVLDPFFRNFWVRRLALEPRSSRQVLDTTEALSVKVGGADVVRRIVEDLKDASEPYRKMVMTAVDRVFTKLGAADIDGRLEEVLMDGVIYAFQEQGAVDSNDIKAFGRHNVMLDGFGVVCTSLGQRCKNYLPQVAGLIKWRLNNKNPVVRQQAAELVGRIAYVTYECDEKDLLNLLGTILHENIGEEYPDVLAAILGGLKAVGTVFEDIGDMKPAPGELLPRLVPILKNKHEKVQEQSIALVGLIADRAPDHVPPREWTRICFDLLEVFSAPRRSIVTAAIHAFGFIAKAIGPQEVIITLLDNLRVQERRSRVCTTIAIAVIADTCEPYTILPAIINEYRVPEMNVQNGVLKSLAYVFEYIAEMGSDYVYSVLPLLEDALTDRDIVHRQTAATCLKHIALGCVGLGYEDACLHLLNFMWPNVFEQSGHVLLMFIEAVEAVGVAVGPLVLLKYIITGLFHPARKVRGIYWKMYNMLYVRAQDALVLAYPRLAAEVDTPQAPAPADPLRYRRDVLEVFI